MGKQKKTFWVITRVIDDTHLEFLERGEMKRWCRRSNQSNFESKFKYTNKLEIKHQLKRLKNRKGIIIIQFSENVPKVKMSVEQFNEDRIVKMNSYKYKTWRNKVFERDGFKCVACCSKENIRAHHLYSWQFYRDKRYDIKNGITLCEKCHNDFHSKYGKIDNTLEQFNEYMKKRKDVLF